MAELLKPLPDWEEHEKPALPGTASYPWHPLRRRLAYAAIAVLVALTGGLGNALVSVNLAQIQAQLGLDPAQGNWLLAAWLMSNVSANLLLFKARQQFGLRLFTEVGLGLYALLAIAHLCSGSLLTTVLLRIASGFAGAACTALGTIYMLQAFPRRHVGRALIIGAGLPQLAVPLAWMLSPALLELGNWHQLYLFEAGLALCAFAAVSLLKLPPGIQTRVFARADLLTFALLAPALALLVAVLSQGQLRWWFDTPWLGWALAAAWLLGLLGLALEHHRHSPLLQVRWLLSPLMLRFIAGAFIIRLLTNEQSFGMVSLLRLLGMGPEQMAPLFAVIALGMVCGIALSALTFGPRALPWQLAGSIVLFAVAAGLDMQRSSVVVPMDLAWSQFLGAMATGIFFGPLMLIGFRLTLARGTDHVVSFIVVLSLTQTFGGLAGSALLGSWQVHREHVHSAALSAQHTPANAARQQQLAQYLPAFSRTQTDPARVQTLAAAQLAQATRIQANVRAFNDVFALSGLIAVLTLGGGLLLPWLQSLRQRRPAPPALH